MKNRPSIQLFSKHRDYTFICEIERKFFKSIAANKARFQGREDPGDQAHSVAAAVSKITSFVDTGGNSGLEILVSFNVSDCRKRTDADVIYLGTQLIPNRNPKECQVTHFIAITKGTHCEVKLHVDLDFDPDSDEPKPSPHFQVGGRQLSPQRGKLSCSWNTKLDKPRLPTLPMCTPLLWHSAFLEFQECASVKPFIREGWWRNIVKEAEGSLWAPFATEMSSAVAKKCSVIEALYPKSIA